MFQALSKDQFLKLAQQKDYVAVYREILADTFTPIASFECLSQDTENSMLLESGLKFRESGSYSFLGFQPYATFKTKNGQTSVINASEETTDQQDPLILLRQFHQKFQCAVEPCSQLAGHMMGFFSYDAVRYFEQLPDQHIDNADIPDILFQFYRINLIFDHETHKLLIAIIVPSEINALENYHAATEEIEQIIQKLKHFPCSISQSLAHDILTEQPFETDCSDQQFQEKVKQAQEFINAGDAFQIVLSRTFSKPISTSPLSIYRLLRYSNPTPYMFYVHLPKFTLFGASPEKLVSVKDRMVTTVPIAGTLPLTDEPSDIILEQLRQDKKQRAEHIMLVDLARNDIGSVCEPGSVHVSDFMHGQRLTHVMHLVSFVKGKLATQYDCFDLLKACFPAGTVSGAPKIRAMEIIDQLELSKRHLYGGAICKIDAEGNMDSCIVIRSGLVKDGQIQVRTGAGIVYDSNPAEESDETRHKAKGILKTVIIAEGAAI